MIQIRLIILIFIIAIGKLLYCQEARFATVVGIKDGDTYVVLIEKNQVTIRLEHVDCPEKKQAFGQAAKKFGSDFCFGREVKVLWNKVKDRNGRWIAEIYYNDKCLNKELVRNGLAWHFKKYSKSKEYADLEIEARKNKMGLWREKEPVAPWEWRKL